jgi:hypothetical protein
LADQKRRRAVFFANASVHAHQADFCSLGHNNMKAKRAKPIQTWGVTPTIDNYDIATNIGHMCVAWACLEFALFRLFRHVSGLPLAVARSVFYSQVTNASRVGLIHATYSPLLTRNYKPTAINRRIKKLLDRLAPLANERNRYVHDPWARRDHGNRIAQFVLKMRGSHGEIRLVRASDIFALTQKIHTAGKRIAKLTDQLSEKFAASRETLLKDRTLTLTYAKKPPPRQRKSRRLRRQPRSSRA